MMHTSLNPHTLVQVGEREVDSHSPADRLGVVSEDVSSVKASTSAMLREPLVDTKRRNVAVALGTPDKSHHATQHHTGQ
jgi:hypothetical protein